MSRSEFEMTHRMKLKVGIVFAASLVAILTSAPHVTLACENATKSVWPHLDVKVLERVSGGLRLQVFTVGKEVQRVTFGSSHLEENLFSLPDGKPETSYVSERTSIHDEALHAFTMLRCGNGDLKYKTLYLRKRKDKSIAVGLATRGFRCSGVVIRDRRNFEVYRSFQTKEYKLATVERI